MDFETVFKLLLEKFSENKVDFALIGGFALSLAGYARTTGDIDWLAAKEDMSRIKIIMKSLGYKLLHESEDVSNFSNDLADLGSVDFLHAHRKYARAMLARAREQEILGGEFSVKVVTPEDLIGLKVQSSSNDPARYYQDMADIEAVLKANAGKLDLDLVKEYFEIFKRGGELKELLRKISHA